MLIWIKARDNPAHKSHARLYRFVSQRRKARLTGSATLAAIVPRDNDVITGKDLRALHWRRSPATTPERGDSGVPRTAPHVPVSCTRRFRTAAYGKVSKRVPMTVPGRYGQLSITAKSGLSSALPNSPESRRSPILGNKLAVSIQTRATQSRHPTSAVIQERVHYASFPDRVDEHRAIQRAVGRLCRRRR